MTSRPIRIGAACIEAIRDKQTNLDHVSRMVEDAAAKGVELLVLPECVVQGYPLGLGIPDLDEYEHQLKEAEPIPGPTTDFLTKLATGNKMELIVGLTEAAAEPGSPRRLYNAQLLIGSRGILGHYRKVHLGGIEKDLWKRGTTWVVAESVAGRIGLLVCYDLVFPECARSLAIAGADLLAMSTAWAADETSGSTFVRGYDLFTRARALENQLYLASSNLVGGAVPGFYGRSRIVDPRGEVISEVAGEGIAIADVDVPTGVIEARARSWFGHFFLNDRVPSTYALLASTEG